MAVHYRTQGFFIRRTDRGEDSQLFTVYTKDFGKLRILGKAIRKIKSKLRSGAELFYLSDIEFIQGKSHKTLTDAILIDSFPAIKESPLKLRIIYKIAEILDDLAVKEEKDNQIWPLLKEVLDKLNSPQFKIKYLPLLYYYFFWNFVSILGYEPKFEHCLINAQETDCDVVKIIKVILKKDWSILSRLRVEARHQKLLKDVTAWYNETIQE